MSRFPSHARLISWAGICPRNDESAGKRRSNRLRKGAPWLKTTLVQCAWAAVKKKDSYLQAQFYRLKARRGPKKVGQTFDQALFLLVGGTAQIHVACYTQPNASADRSEIIWLPEHVAQFMQVAHLLHRPLIRVTFNGQPGSPELRPSCDIRDMSVIVIV